MNYKSFEELPCWHKARELSRSVYETINQGMFEKDYSLKERIWRAAGSVMDNIAEGFDDGSSREMILKWARSNRRVSP